MRRVRWVWLALVAGVVLLSVAVCLWYVATRPRPRPPKPEKRTFQSRLAGTWYSADREALTAQLTTYLENVPPQELRDLHALILPHAGYQYSGQTAAYGVKLVGRLPFIRVVVLGPSHYVPMENVASVPDYTHYATSLGEVPIDLEFIAALKQYPWFKTIPIAHEEEHSVQIQVPLLQRVLSDFSLVPIVVGELDLETVRMMGRVLAGLVDPKTLVIASSDFTHYGPRFGYVPFRENVPQNIQELDRKSFEYIRRKDEEGFLSFVRNDGPTICGYCPIAVLLAMVPETSQGQWLHYETSGALTGDFTQSVSYLAVAFTGRWADLERLPPPPPLSLSDADKQRVLQIARETLAFTLEHRRVPELEELNVEITPAMKQIAGVFVTLYKNGRLRGCVGQVCPCRPLYRGVMLQTLNAALNDRRFPPVRPEELGELAFQVSLFREGPRPVDSYTAIELGRHGIIIEKQGRQALFLPKVPLEEGWTLEETLDHLCLKAELPRDAWKSGASFSVFEGTVFPENPEQSGAELDVAG